MPRHQWTRSLGLLLPAFPLLTCSDPSGPCDRPSACEMPGVDLYVEVVEILSAAFDPADGLRIVEPGPVTIHVSVRNRGDAVSLPGAVELGYGRSADGEFVLKADLDTVPTPALRPGESFQFTIDLETYEIVDRPRTPAIDGLTYATAAILDPDADPTNNFRESPRVHVRIAVLDAVLELSTSSIDVNKSYPARLKIRNSSAHGAAPPAVVGFLLFDLGGEYSSVLGFGIHDIPAIEPLGVYEEELLVTVPAESAWQHSAQQARIWIRTAPPGTSTTQLINSWKGVNVGGPVVSIRPDYAACAPPLLQADSAVVSLLTCTNPLPFYVFELGATADRWYAIEQERFPGVTIYSPAGERLGDWYPGQWIRFAAPGQYFLVDFELEKYPQPSKYIILRALPPGVPPPSGAMFQ